MEQLEQLAQWVSSNQQMTLIAAIGCVFFALVFLFWATREFTGWFMRTASILEEVQELRGEILELKEHVRYTQQAQTLSTLYQAIEQNLTIRPAIDESI